MVKGTRWCCWREFVLNVSSVRSWSEGVGVCYPLRNNNEGILKELF